MKIRIDSSEATFAEWGSEGPPVHFYHANGYPPGVYSPLLERLAESLSLETLALRALWPGIGNPPKTLRWQAYADDLIAFLDARDRGPVIAIGHSMGATATVMAAARRPDLFSQLVLIEPAAVKTWLAMLDHVVPFTPRRWVFQPGKATLRRRYRWRSRSAFEESIRRWRSLERLDEEAIKAFAGHAVRSVDDGTVELVFPRAWEAHNYFCPTAIWPSLARIRCPVFVLRSEPSMFFSESMWSSWARRHPGHHIRKINGFGHLLPLESPAECAEAILSVL